MVGLEFMGSCRWKDTYIHSHIYIHSYSKDGSIHNEMTKLALTWIQRGP